MKKTLLVISTIFALSGWIRAETIVQWDFNLPFTGDPGGGDNDGLTGTFSPYIGIGTFEVINVGSNRFGGISASSDPWLDNSALRLATFPGSAVSNKTAGVQFFTSTVGFENIQVAFDQMNSATASRYWRVQYTTDGSTWTDHVVLESAGSTAWLNQRVVDFSTVTAVKNNPNFGVRYVSEFQSTATGSGSATYIGNSGTYGTGGTHWMDMVVISGTPLDTSNTDPTISSITNQSIRVNQTVGPLAFTIGDAETPVGSLSLSAISSKPELIQNFTFGGEGANRTIAFSPEPNQSGLAMITVTVTDSGGKAASSSFNVLVRAPSLSIANQAVIGNSTANASLQISEFEGFLGSVNVTADAANLDLFPPGTITFSGSGSNRTASITPAANQVGGTAVLITATDGSLVATNSIFVTVVPTNTITLWDFNSEFRDFNEATGTLDPLFGAGLAQPVGDIASSVNNTIAADSFDPDIGDSTKWRLGTFAAPFTSNKLTGVEFRLSTLGRQDISMAWNHYNSATGSRFWRIQYSIDGVNFIDQLSYSNALVTTWFQTNTSFAGLSGVDNNPNFAVRLVSEFDSTAVGGNSTNENYVGVQSTTGVGGYGSGGTLWLDMIDFRGAPFTGVTQAILSVVYSNGNILISWPDNAVGTLESVSSLGAIWQPVAENPVQADGKYTVTVSATGDARFFRLNQ